MKKKKILKILIVLVVLLMFSGIVSTNMTANASELYFDEGTMITSMVDIYIKREKDMLVTTYTIQDNGVEYRILGFASLKDLW